MHPKNLAAYLLTSSAATLLLLSVTAQPLSAQSWVGYQPEAHAAGSSGLASLFDSEYNGVRTDYIGADQDVHELFLYGGVWQDANLTSIAQGIIAFTGSGIASVVDPLYDNAVRAYYVDADRDMHELFLFGGAWQDADLTILTVSGGTAAGSAVATLFDPVYKGVRTDYISRDQHLHELFLSGGVWQDADLTTIAGGAAVSKGSGLVSMVDPAYSNAVRTYYIDSNQHVHQLLLSSGSWHDGDLTAVAGVTNGAPDSKLAGLFDPIYSVIRTYYIGADHHVHELLLSSGAFHDVDLTAATGGPATAAGSTLATLFDSNYDGVRTDYISSDQHVHELFFSNGVWQDADLTSIAGGVAVSNGSGLVSIVDPIYSNAVRLYYTGADQHVHELFLFGGVWHDGDLTDITGSLGAATN